MKKQKWLLQYYSTPFSHIHNTFYSQENGISEFKYIIQESPFSINATNVKLTPIILHCFAKAQSMKFVTHPSTIILIHKVSECFFRGFIADLQLLVAAISFGLGFLGQQGAVLSS